MNRWERIPCAIVPTRPDRSPQVEPRPRVCAVAPNIASGRTIASRNLAPAPSIYRSVGTRSDRTASDGESPGGGREKTARMKEKDRGEWWESRTIGWATAGRTGEEMRAIGRSAAVDHRGWTAARDVRVEWKKKKKYRSAYFARRVAVAAVVYCFLTTVSGARSTGCLFLE